MRLHRVFFSNPLSYINSTLAAQNPIITVAEEPLTKFLIEPTLQFALKNGLLKTFNNSLQELSPIAEKLPSQSSPTPAPAVRLPKRLSTTTSATLTPTQLYALCPLSQITTNSNVAAGCVAGIYMNYCYSLPASEAAYRQCFNVYDQVFSQSIFKALGDVCPKWKFGPSSAECHRAISTFSYNLGYMTVTSNMAQQLVDTIFKSKYAPCANHGSIVCRP
jgi:hypothetical protein